MKWRKVKGFPNYEVSSSGVVKNNKGVIRKQRKDRDGYQILDLKYNGQRKTVRVHRLVMGHFGGLSKRKNQVNHVKGDKSDNRISALENVTPSENSTHSRRTGLYGRYTVKKHLRKKKNGCSFVKQHTRKNNHNGKKY